MDERELEEWRRTRDFGLTYYTIAEPIEDDIKRQLELHEAKAAYDRITGALQDTYTDEIEEIIISFRDREVSSAGLCEAKKCGVTKKK